MRSKWTLGRLAGVEWIHVAQERDIWRAVVNAVMNLPVLAPRSWMKNAVPISTAKREIFYRFSATLIPHKILGAHQILLVFCLLSCHHFQLFCPVRTQSVTSRVPNLMYNYSF
jgi:hypothetical protein